MSENESANLDNILEDPQPKRTGLSAGSIVLLVGVLTVVAVVGLQLITRQGQVRPTSGPAPDFTFITFDGDEFRLEDYRGKVVIVNFWGSWCAPCRDEAPELQRIHEQYQDVVVVGVAYLDTPTNAQNFVDEFDLTYANGMDPGSAIAEGKYHIQGAPENFIIDQNGDIALFYSGAVSQRLLSPILNDLLTRETAS
jgi:cytochrome c biogenesis protein CcmG/thiol:disulfide interchange protein DsbE